MASARDAVRGGACPPALGRPRSPLGPRTGAASSVFRGLAGGGLFALLVSLSCAVLCAGPWLKARAIMGQQTSELVDRFIIVDEHVDVFNDDFRRPLRVDAVTAESWFGYRHLTWPEPQLFASLPLTIAPGRGARGVARYRRVPFRRNRSWYERYVRFHVTTDRGVLTTQRMLSAYPLPDNLPGTDTGSFLER